MFNTPWWRKLSRRWFLFLLKCFSPEYLLSKANVRRRKILIATIRDVAAYKELLNNENITLDLALPLDDIWQTLPILDKNNTFHQFGLEDLLVSGNVGNIATMITSSGHSGKFGFGVSSRLQLKHLIADIDLGLQQSFSIDTKSTLLINMLPMGIRLISDTIAVAETSVREDMAYAVLDTFSAHYDQVILLTDPLFLKRFLDYAQEKGTQWPKNRTHCIIGEETFGENFRNYTAKKLNADHHHAEGAMIVSTFGAGELGLNLLYETRETLALKNILHTNSCLAERILGHSCKQSIPMIFIYNPLNIYLETIEENQHGIGDLLISTLSEQQLIPLLRYKTGDKGKLLNWKKVNNVLTENGLLPIAETNFPLMAMYGRENEILPNGYNILDIKECLYRREALADIISGAWRLIDESEDDWILHIQLNDTAPMDKGSLVAQFTNELPFKCQVKLWSKSAFPFGKQIDYERKFSYRSQNGNSKKH
jgi:phenylacetate-CoA ligase